MPGFRKGRKIGEANKVAWQEWMPDKDLSDLQERKRGRAEAKKKGAKLETLSSYNERRAKAREDRQALNPKGTGLSCDTCGEELIYTSTEPAAEKEVSCNNTDCSFTVGVKVS